MNIRKVIRTILLENAAPCGGINKTLWTGMMELNRLGLHIVSDWRPEEYDSGAAKYIALTVYDDLGDEKAYWLGEYQVTGEPCLGAFQCTNTDAQNLRGTGVGALLYDVACELTGEKGVSSDRSEVSNSAWRMWVYMTLNDQTYDIKGSYDYDGEQTPDDPSDDCMSRSWEDYEDRWADKPSRNPLNYVFVKKNQSRPTISCLASRGLIKYED